MGDSTNTASTSCSDLYIVRVYDGFDNQWTDVSEPVPLFQAANIWHEKTGGGTHNTNFEDIDYYRIFPAHTEMLYAKGRGAR